MRILITTLGPSVPVDILLATGRKMGHQTDLSTYGKLQLKFDNQNGLAITTENNVDLKEYDLIIPRTPKYYLHICQQIARYAKNQNKFMINGHSINTYPLYEKALQYTLLTEKNIPIIPSVLSKRKISFPELSGQFGHPFIYKNIFGYCGLDVFKIDSQDDFAKVPDFKIVDKNNRSYLAQNYWPISEDYRVIVLGEKALGVMKRSADQKGEFRTNFSLGGKVEAVPLSDELSELAVAASQAVLCDIAGVDILYHEGKPYIIEVNRYCGFEGFNQSHPEMNVAEEIIKYGLNKIAGN